MIEYLVPAELLAIDGLFRTDAHFDSAEVRIDVVAFEINCERALMKFIVHFGLPCLGRSVWNRRMVGMQGLARIVLRVLVRLGALRTILQRRGHTVIVRYRQW